MTVKKFGVFAQEGWLKLGTPVDFITKTVRSAGQTDAFS